MNLILFCVSGGVFVGDINGLSCATGYQKTKKHKSKNGRQKKQKNGEENNKNKKEAPAGNFYVLCAFRPFLWCFWWCFSTCFGCFSVVL